MAMVFGSESFERFLQSSWEMYVDNCRLPVICFSRIYISMYSWWKYHYPWWLFTISNAVESGIPMSRSFCALWPGLVEVSHPLGVYYPLGVCQREADLHLLIHRPWYPYLRESWILMYFCHTSPRVALNGEWSGFCWYLHSFMHTFAGL